MVRAQSFTTYGSLSAYMQQLALASREQINADSVGQLTSQASVVLGCGTSGFSLGASPSSALLSTHSPASYALAITPIGNFAGKVSLACIGAPKGANCTLSSRSVVLDGVSQSSVSLTVTAAGTGSENTDHSGSERRQRPQKLTPGLYSFIVQANGIGTTRDTLLTLVVK